MIVIRKISMQHHPLVDHMFGYLPPIVLRILVNRAETVKQKIFILPRTTR